jgi:hypothetical protein
LQTGYKKTSYQKKFERKGQEKRRAIKKNLTEKTGCVAHRGGDTIAHRNAPANVVGGSITTY